MTEEPKAGVMTQEEFWAAVDALEKKPLKVCEHVVHPKAEGWTMCGTCFQPVHQPKGTHEGCEGNCIDWKRVRSPDVDDIGAPRGIKPGGSL